MDAVTTYVGNRLHLLSIPNTSGAERCTYVRRPRRLFYALNCSWVPSAPYFKEDCDKNKMYITIKPGNADMGKHSWRGHMMDAGGIVDGGQCSVTAGDDTEGLLAGASARARTALKIPKEDCDRDYVAIQTVGQGILEKENAGTKSWSLLPQELSQTSTMWRTPKSLKSRNSFQAHFKNVILNIDISGGEVDGKRENSNGEEDSNGSIDWSYVDMTPPPNYLSTTTSSKRTERGNTEEREHARIAGNEATGTGSACRLEMGISSSRVLMHREKIDRRSKTVSWKDTDNVCSQEQGRFAAPHSLGVNASRWGEIGRHDLSDSSPLASRPGKNSAASREGSSMSVGRDDRGAMSATSWSTELSGTPAQNPYALTDEEDAEIQRLLFGGSPRQRGTAGGVLAASGIAISLVPSTTAYQMTPGLGLEVDDQGEYTSIEVPPGPAAPGLS